MENLSDDDFRSYMTDFQSYLHNIGDLGPIEPPSSSVESVNTTVSPTEPMSESSINSAVVVAMNKEQEHRTTGMESDGQRVHLEEEEEEDEDRIVAEGCDLDCVAKDPDLTSDQRNSGWFPDVTKDEDEALRPEVASEDLAAESEGYSEHPQRKPVEEKTQNEHSDIDREWEVEASNGPSRPDLEISAETEISDYDLLEHHPRTSSSSVVDENASWRYSGDGLIHTEEAQEVSRQDVTSGDGVKVTDEEEHPKVDEVLVDFGETEPIAQEGPQSWQGHDFRDEVNSDGEEVREDAEEDGSKAIAAEDSAAAAANGESNDDARGLVTSSVDGVDDADIADSVSNIQPGMETDDIGAPSDSTTFQASEQGLQEDFEEEKAYIEELEARYWEENAREMQSAAADEQNKNSLIGYEEVTESSSDVKQPQNGAPLRIYPSQVKKTNHFLPGAPDGQDADLRAPEEVLSPGENENEEEEQRGLPEQGSVKSLLAQWRQIEQQKRKPGAAKDEADDEPHQQRHRAAPLSSGWSQASPEDDDNDDEIQPTRSRVRDEILRMRSQSCDPMASRKHSRQSPNDDDVPSVGKRTGRGRSRMEDGQDEAEDTEHYRSQPSLTKAILAKFENLDLQAASSAIKPKSNKNFKWQVKETTRFCRPGFVPRSGR